MQFVIEQEVLLPALKHVSTVVEKRGTMPILANVRVEASAPASVKLTATNLDIELTDTVAAHVTQGGVTTVSAQKLLDIVANLDKTANVTVSVAEESMQVKSGRRRFKLGCLDPQDFPSVPIAESAASFTIAAEAFARIIDKTLPFVSNEATRYYLNGVHLHVVDGDLRAVSTNGAALALVINEVPDGASEIPSIIIPSKTCAIATKLFAGGEISVMVSATTIVLRNEASKLVSKLIDGTFPDYSRVIPQNNPNTLSADNQAMQRGIEAVSCIQEEKTKSIAISLQDSTAEISATGGIDAGSDVIDAEYSGTPIKIGFNSTYALEILSNIDAESVKMEIAGPQDPVVFRGVNDVSSTFVLMPMRV